MFTTIFSAIGETYLSDDDVLWWAKGGKLKGKSPEESLFSANSWKAFLLPLNLGTSRNL